MKTKLTFLLALTFLFLFSGSVYGDDFQDGLDAQERKDYKTAYKLWLPLAEQGNAFAQFNLGLMYAKGLGVPQDYKEAVRWFRLAAEQGHAKAQYNLGLMYYNGQGVPQDYVLAHMWFNLSSSQGMTTAIKVKNIVEKKMSKQQIEKAQEMARNWKPKTKFEKLVKILVDEDIKRWTLFKEGKHFPWDAFNYIDENKILSRRYHKN